MLSTSDKYGRVSFSIIKVTGQFKRVVVRSSPANPWPNNSNGTFVDFPLSRAWIDIHFEGEEVMLAMLLCAVQEELPAEYWSTYALLLTPVYGKERVFRRKGLAMFWDEKLIGFENDTIAII